MTERAEKEQKVRRLQADIITLPHCIVLQMEKEEKEGRPWIISIQKICFPNSFFSIEIKSPSRGAAVVPWFSLFFSLSLPLPALNSLRAFTFLFFFLECVVGRKFDNFVQGELFAHFRVMHTKFHAIFFSR